MEYVRNGYPKLVIDLNALKTNISQVTKRCEEKGIEVAGVIKGCNGLIPCAEQFYRAGCRWIASSRLEQLAPLKDAGIQSDLMLVRIPMLSEAEDVVRICEYSLNSEVAVLKELNKFAGMHDKTHNVIIMADCGDLREGFWDKEEMADVAFMVENELHNLHLAGVGVNVGCYGSVQPTPEKLQELVDIAETIEDRIGRELEIISGGATSSFMRVVDGNIPPRINMLRIGEGVLLAYDLPALYGYDLPYLSSNTFRLRAEVVEVKDKPSHPVGEIGFDAFGHRIEYVDRGIRRRAVLGIGKVDYGDPSELIPTIDGIEVLGASSDHTLLDIQDLIDAGGDMSVGDIVEFQVNYATMVYLTSSDNVTKVYI
ncbi:MAG: alanine racemase [Bacillota bacterium]|nr:alanine racemase [Bacillota bacterium]